MQRINKAIELLAASQPLYYVSSHDRFEIGYDSEQALAQTWGDYIIVEMEHGVFDALLQYRVGGGRQHAEPNAVHYRVSVSPRILAPEETISASPVGNQARAGSKRDAFWK